MKVETWCSPEGQQNIKYYQFNTKSDFSGRAELREVVRGDTIRAQCSFQFGFTKGDTFNVLGTLNTVLMPMRTACILADLFEKRFKEINKEQEAEKLMTELVLHRNTLGMVQNVKIKEDFDKYLEKALEKMKE